MKNVILIGAGVAAAAGIAFYFLRRNQGAQQLAPGQPQSSLPTSNSAPVVQAYTPGSKQTMWKDKDGNIFQITSDKGKWGFIIKVNGSIHGKWNQMETMFLRSDGHVVGADNNGSVYEWKNNQWNYIIKDNKSQADEYLAKNGQPRIFSGVSGLGCYLLS